MSDAETANDISVEINQSFDISLYSQAGSTGYLWCLSGLKTGIVLLGETSTPIPPAMSGSQTRQTFTFVATKKVTGKLSFALIRPWTPDVAADTRSFTVQVTETSAVVDAVSKTAGSGSFVKNETFLSHYPPVALYDAPRDYSECCSASDGSGETAKAMPFYGFPATSRTSAAQKHIVVAYGFPANPTGAHAFVASTGDNCMVKYGFPQGIATNPNDCVLKYGFPTQGRGPVIPLYGYPPVDSNTCAMSVEASQDNCVVKYGVPAGIATNKEDCNLKYGFPVMKYGFPAQEDSKS